MYCTGPDSNHAHLTIQSVLTSQENYSVERIRKLFTGGSFFNINTVNQFKNKILHCVIYIKKFEKHTTAVYNLINLRMR